MLHGYAPKQHSRRPSRMLTQVLHRTLSQKERHCVAAGDPAELSTQPSAPGVLKVFGDEVCEGAHYKSVLATPRSSARELVREALLRYGLAGDDYVLCDVVGELEGPGGHWRPEGLRVLGDDERPLLLQDLWRPKEGFARRLELRRRAEVENVVAREKDTSTAGINAQARRLQRSRAKGTVAPSPTPTISRSQSETSLNVAAGPEGQPKRHYLTLPGPPKGQSGRDGPQGGRQKQEKEGYEVRQSLYQSPHLLLLQGFSRKDCLVYLLNRDQHTVGQETASARPSICLWSPDVLPLHCTIRKAQPAGRLVAEPAPGASVLVNFTLVRASTPLRHGDLLSFGGHYVFLYKDPVRDPEPLPAQTLASLRALGPAGCEACRTCGTLVGDRRPLRRSCPFRRRLHLEYERPHEDQLVERIVTLVDPSGDDHRLTPAYLLCLCIDHSATAFEPGSFGKLTLKIAKRTQALVQDKTKKLAEKQAQHQDPGSLSLPGITGLAPGLRPVLFWMSNAVEVLYFVQQKSPGYVKRMGHSDSDDMKESLLSATVSANEEAMAVLEEVIIYAFQQCVYYITKSLYVSLSGLLDCSHLGKDGPGTESVNGVLQVYQTTRDLLHHCEVHPEVQSQVFAYLFFFSNVSLFNQLLDKGLPRGWFKQSSGVRLQAALRVLLDWTRRTGLFRLANKFFAKFCSAVGILAIPPQQLAQMSWKSLSARYPALKAVQLQHILTQCQLGAQAGPDALRYPSPEEEVHVWRADLLESFDEHPPIVLPSSGFKVDLDRDDVDDGIYRQLLYVRHFLWGLKTKAPVAIGRTEPQRDRLKLHGHSNPAAFQTEVEVDTRALAGSILNTVPGATSSVGECSRDDSQWAQVHVNGFLHQRVQTSDTSCLLTPPTTPHCPRIETQLNDHAKVLPNLKRVNGFISNEMEVVLDKGPFGLGLGLIDGLHTPLKCPGIYIRTLIPGGPAASDGRLCIGDRILAVNGTDVTGADYQSAVDLIRWGGGRLHFLVAKMDHEVSEKMAAMTF